MTAAHILKKQYAEDSNTDFHKMIADMARIPRTTAKTINLGLFYGMGKGKLASLLILSMTDANDLFTRYHREVPFVKQLSKAFQDFADETRLIFTVEDRILRFDKWETKDKKWNAEVKAYQIKRYVRIKNEETGYMFIKTAYKEVVSNSELKDYNSKTNPLTKLELKNYLKKLKLI